MQIDWEYNKLDLGILTHKNLCKPTLTLNAIINLIDYHKTYFETKIPYMADLGIFGINSHNLKLELLEKPKKMKELILHEIPENIYLRI